MVTLTGNTGLETEGENRIIKFKSLEYTEYFNPLFTEVRTVLFSRRPLGSFHLIIYTLSSQNKTLFRNLQLINLVNKGLTFNCYELVANKTIMDNT